MYSVGETILYGINGVCTIDDITERKIGKEKLEYYVLKPVDSAASTLFVPVNNEMLVNKIRYTKSADELRGIFKRLPKQEEWINNKYDRSERFKEIISRADCAELINLIRLINAHEKLQHENGKRLHIADERILKEAEKIVVSEFSYVLNISRSEALEMILN